MNILFELNPKLQEKLRERALKINENLGKQIVTTDWLGKDDMTGRVYGQLYILKYVGRTMRKDNIYLCYCENCENEVFMRANNIRNLNQTDCGCSKYTSDACRTKLYRVFIQMNRRCYDPRDPNYERYGAKGRTVCDEWNPDVVGTALAFANFLKWSYDNGYEEREGKEKLTLERENNNLGYSPENCSWKDHKHQNVNTSRNKYYQYGKYYFPRTYWAEICGMPRNTLKYRLDGTWSVEDALLTPPFQLPGNNKRHIVVPKSMLEFNKYEKGLETGECYYVEENPEYISEEE